VPANHPPFFCKLQKFFPVLAGKFSDFFIFLIAMIYLMVDNPTAFILKIITTKIINN